MKANQLRQTLTFTCAALAITIAATFAFPLDSHADSDAAVVYLVRHAEQTVDGRDPQLSAEGRQRASLLAYMMRDAGITHIFSTDFNRTRETAAPLAKQLGLEIEIYHWNEKDRLASSLNRPGNRSLVVGHSNTTPELVEMLGGEPGGKIDVKSEYDRLYILTIASSGFAETVLIRSGIP
jgi:phosphohistidine phosphatase SixA